jgi:hypothetical protein
MKRVLLLTRTAIIVFVAICVLIVGGYVLLRFSGSTIDPSLERVIYDGKESDSPLININGMTQETRILAPEGYTRIEADETSLLHFMRNMEVLPHGNPIVFYDGDEHGNNCALVYAMDIGAHDLQQCADSVIRVYSEYYWSQKDYDSIAFHLTNGELMKYTDWRKGKRLVAAGSFSTQLKLKGKNKSYECFRAYLECVMNYAGTKSLYDESETIPLSDFKPGDILLIPGSPGHVVLAVDMAVNADGEKCYLFAQGYMPAQSFHMIENDKHLDDPWFYESELKEKFRVDSYTFTDDNIRRWQNGF